MCPPSEPDFPPVGKRRKMLLPALEKAGGERQRQRDTRERQRQTDKEREREEWGKGKKVERKMRRMGTECRTTI